MLTQYCVQLVQSRLSWSHVGAAIFSPQGPPLAVTWYVRGVFKNLRIRVTILTSWRFYLRIRSTYWNLKMQPFDKLVQRPSNNLRISDPQIWMNYNMILMCFQSLFIFVGVFFVIIRRSTNPYLVEMFEVPKIMSTSIAIGPGTWISPSTIIIKT